MALWELYSKEQPNFRGNVIDLSKLRIFIGTRCYINDLQYIKLRIPHKSAMVINFSADFIHFKFIMPKRFIY